MSEIYLDVETQRLSREVSGGCNNIRDFGLSVAVTWNDAAGFREWYESDAARRCTWPGVRDACRLLKKPSAVTRPSDRCPPRQVPIVPIGAAL